MMSFKLLLADDSVTIHRIIELTLADEDIRVVAVGDGQQAIERLRQERPDIVLADISMPRPDGYEIAAFAAGQPSLAGVPVVLLTGAFDPVDEQRVREVGASGVLVKPFEPHLVINRVRELLGLPAGAASSGPPAGSPPHADAPAPPAPRPNVLQSKPPEPSASHGDDQPDVGGATNEASPADYFDRLDAAFATLESRGGEPARTAPRSRPWPAAAPRGDAEPANADGGGAISCLADVFAALLAAEQGQPVSIPLPAAVPEAVIDRIVERVLARLSDRVVRQVVADLVSDTAERLVREEIARLRQGAE